jgi:hypothetical protein
VIAGDDIAADLNSALFTGTQLDIAAIDHITPIATTPASPIHVPVRICIPSVCVGFGKIGGRIFFDSRM